ncbi:hypothetical protein V7157_16520 [Neobacillus drentensis]|uniref:hypothetical protein n=1 Tax=Neobacillus drentensis TaxID=220684 RepID=UPI00300192DA
MNLLKLEMMNATERIAEALQMRGLFIEVKDDFIILSDENTQEDITKTKQLISSLAIPTFWQDNQFQVLVNRSPIVTMKKIIERSRARIPCPDRRLSFPVESLCSKTVWN